MVKVTADKLMNGSFVRVMQKLTSTPMDPYASYRIKLVVKEIQKAQDKIRHQYKTEIREVFADRDEKNNIIPDDTGSPNGFKVKKEQAEAFDKAQEAFGNQEIDIESKKIKFDDVARVSLSASELTAIDAILEEPSVENLY